MVAIPSSGGPGFRAVLDTSELAEAGRDMRRLMKRMPDPFLAQMDGVAALLQGEVRATSPIFTGELANGIQLRPAAVIPTAEGFSIRSTVFTAVPHGVVVEYGRRPGKWPPRGPIERWVTLKSRRGDMDLGWTGRKKESDQIKAAAFVIARKIGLVGIGAKKVFEKAAEKIAPVFQAAMERAAEEAARILGSKS